MSYIIDFTYSLSVAHFNALLAFRQAWLTWLTCGDCLVFLHYLVGSLFDFHGQGKAEVILI